MVGVGGVQGTYEERIEIEMFLSPAFNLNLAMTRTVGKCAKPEICQDTKLFFVSRFQVVGDCTIIIVLNFSFSSAFLRTILDTLSIECLCHGRRRGPSNPAHSDFMLMLTALTFPAHLKYAAALFKASHYAPQYQPTPLLFMML